MDDRNVNAACRQMGSGSRIRHDRSPSPQELNPLAHDIVDDILMVPGSVYKANMRGGVDVIAPDGRGVRYDPDGSLYLFLE